MARERARFEMTSVARIRERLRASSFIGSVGVYVVGGTVHRAAVFALVPLYTRYLTAAEFGLWGILNSILIVLTVVLDLGISKSVLRYYFDHDSDDARVRGYMVVSFGLRVAATVLLVALAYCLGRPLWALSVGDGLPYTPYVPLLLAAVAGETLGLMVIAVYRAQNRPLPFILARGSQAILQLSLSAVLVAVMGFGVLGAIIGQAVGAAVVGTVVAVAFVRENLRGGLRIEIEDVWHNLRYGVPLIAHELAWWVRSSADPIILAQFVSLASIGVYHLGYMAGLALSFLVHSIDLAYAPRYYRTMRTNARAHIEVATYASRFIGFIGVLCTFGMLFAGEVIVVVADASYAGAGVIAPIVLAGYFLHAQYVLYVKPLAYHKRTGLIPLLTVVPSMAGIYANTLLVPHFGAIAAAWVTVATFAVVAAAVYGVSQRIDAVPYSTGRILFFTCLVLLTGVWSALLSPEYGTLEAFLTKGVILALVAVAAWRMLLDPGHALAETGTAAAANPMTAVTGSAE